MGIFKYSFARTAGGWTTTGTSPVALAPSPSFNGDPSLVIPAGDNLRNALAYDTMVGVASGDTIVVSVAVRAASGSGTATITAFVHNFESSQTSVQGPVGITSAGWTTITQTIVVSPLMGNNPGCAINVQCSSAAFVGEISIAGDQLNTVVPVWNNFHTQPGDPGHWVGGGGVWRTPGGGGGIYVVPNPQSGTTYNTDTDTVPLAGMPGAIPVGGNNFPELGIPSPTHVQTTVVLPGVSPGDTIHFRPHTSPSRNTSPFLQILVTWLDRAGNPVGPVASFSTVGPDTPASYGVVVPAGAGSNPNVRIQIHPNTASLFYLFRLDLYSDALGKNVYTALFHGGEIPPAIGIQGLNIKAPDAGFFDPAVGIMVIAGNGAATPADQRDTLRIIPDPATPAWEVVLALTFAKNDKDKLTLGFKAKTEVGSSIVHAYVQWGDFNSGSLIGNKVAVCGGSVSTGITAFSGTACGQ